MTYRVTDANNAAETLRFTIEVEEPPPPTTGGKIYWTSISHIDRANLDGSGYEIVLSYRDITPPNGLAIHNGKIYWPSYNDIFIDGDGTISRANLDGSGREVLISSRLDRPEGIAIHGGKMYWADGLHIEEANLDGAGRQILISEGVPEHIAIGPAGASPAVSRAAGASPLTPEGGWEAARVRRLTERMRADRMMAERAAAGLPPAR